MTTSRLLPLDSAALAHVNSKPVKRRRKCWGRQDPSAGHKYSDALVGHIKWMLQTQTPGQVSEALGMRYEYVLRLHQGIFRADVPAKEWLDAEMEVSE